MARGKRSQPGCHKPLVRSEGDQAQGVCANISTLNAFASAASTVRERPNELFIKDERRAYGLKEESSGGCGVR